MQRTAQQPEPPSQFVTAKETRVKLTYLLNEAHYRDARFFVTKNGKTMAVLLGIEDYERIAGSVAREQSTSEVKLHMKMTR